MSIHSRDAVTRRQRRRVRADRPELAKRLTVQPSTEPFAPTLHAPREVARQGSAGAWSMDYLRRVVVADLIVAFVASGLAVLLRFGVELRLEYLLATLAMPFVWVLALSLSNGYERRYLGVSTEEYRAVGRATIGVTGLVAVGAYLAHQDVARRYTLMLILFLFVGGLLVRHISRRWLQEQRAEGKLMQRTLIVGRADAAAALVRSIKAEPGQGLEPVAVCASGMDTSWDATSLIEGVPVMGTPRDAVAAADLYDAEVVAVASHPDLAGKALRRLAWALEERGVELIVSPGLLDVAGPRLSIRPSTNLSLLHIERPAATRRSVVLKSLMDRTLAFLLLLALAPLLITTALAIKITDPGPVLFKQRRVGVRGEIFGIYKFRTMVVDAEKMLASLKDVSDGNGVLFKMQDDPRVTKVGKILRRYSIDELPQLFNVLFGEMSLVGPRPPLPAEVEQYEPDALRRLHVRPGMTGLWQVSGRSDLSWEESLRLDLRYVDNWSPIGDLSILFRTFRAVTQASGAY